MISPPPAKEVNISVIVRARPMNAREVAQGARPVLRLNTQANIVDVQSIGKLQGRTYQFDRVFSGEAPQDTFYQEVVSPVIQDFLVGFNCTIFAYGQTGTGKSYTMTGEQMAASEHVTAAKYLDLSAYPKAGVIPRAINEIFTTLDAQNADYQLRVSHMEVYCEEIYDLLRDSADDREPLRLFEERLPLTGKGEPRTESYAANVQSGEKASTRLVILGLEEVLVKSPTEVLALLSRSNENRRVAETKMNASSSRSHAIFTISLVTKETHPDQETDLIKIAKLNLVDLAGSESAGKSGATGDRQQEASKINRSLLTLGRVINALTETKQHIPYRESKLTRLLQDSLGGRTKTCIIATISPCDNAVDETMNTLEYMSRAKKIRNLPEVATRVSGKTVLREYTLEIKRLRDLLSAQKAEHGGVFVKADVFDELNEAANMNREKIQEYQARIDYSEQELKKLTILCEAESHKAGVLQKTLQKTTDRVNELHAEKLRLYEKIKVGRAKEAKNLAMYERLKKAGASAVLQQTFNSESLQTIVESSGVGDSLVQIDQTIELCRLELAGFEDSLRTTLSTGLTTFRERTTTLLNELLKPVIESSTHLISTSLPSEIGQTIEAQLRKSLNEELTAFLNERITELTTECTSHTTAIKKTLQSAQGRLTALHHECKQQMEDVTAALNQQASFLQDMLVEGTKTVEKLVTDTTAELAAGRDKVRDELETILASSVKNILAVYDDATAACEGRAISLLNESANSSIERFQSIERKASEAINDKRRDVIASMHDSIMENITGIEQAVASLISEQNSHTDAVQASRLRFINALPTQMDTIVMQPIQASAQNIQSQLRQISNNLTDVHVTFDGQFGKSVTTMSDTLTSSANSILKTHIHENLLQKTLSLMDHPIRDTSRMGAILAGRLLRDKAESAESRSATITGMTLDSIVSMAGKLERAVSGALTGLIDHFCLTPVIPTGGPAGTTPALTTPYVRPISLGGGEYAYGIASPTNLSPGASGGDKE